MESNGQYRCSMKQSSPVLNHITSSFREPRESYQPPMQTLPSPTFRIPVPSVHITPQTHRVSFLFATYAARRGICQIWSILKVIIKAQTRIPGSVKIVFADRSRVWTGSIQPMANPRCATLVATPHIDHNSSASVILNG